MLKPIHAFTIAIFSIFGFLILLLNLLAWQDISLLGKNDISGTYFGIGSLLHLFDSSGVNAGNLSFIEDCMAFMKNCFNHLSNAIFFGANNYVRTMSEGNTNWLFSMDVINMFLTILDSVIGWVMVPIYACGMLGAAVLIASTYLFIIFSALGGYFNFVLPSSHYDMPGSLHIMLIPTMRNICII